MNVTKTSRENNPLTSSGGASNPNNNNNTPPKKTPTLHRERSKQVATLQNGGRVTSTSPVNVPPNAVKSRPEREGIAITTRNAIVEKFQVAINTGNLEEVKRILEEGQIKINSRDSKQNTPLHNAIIADKFEIASYLATEGVNPSLSNEFGNTPLHLACTKQTSAYVDLVINVTNKPLASSNPLTSSVSSPTISRTMRMGVATPPLSTSPLSTSPSTSVLPLFSGATSQTTIIPPLNSFLNKPNTKGNTAIHLACFHGNFDAVKTLLSKAAELTTNTEGWTPLHYAAAMGHHAIVSFLLHRYPPPIIDSRDASGRTPFLLAAAGGHTESVKILAKSGSDTSLVSETGDSALHLAIRHLATLQAQTPDLTLVEELLSMNVNVTGVTHNGNSPLHIACLYGASSVVDLLLANKKITAHEVNQLNNKLHSPLYLSTMRPAYHHYTPYQGSHERERLGIVRSLLNAGALIEKRAKETGKAKCVMHTAAKNGFGDILTFLTTTVAPVAPNRRGGGGLSPPNRNSEQPKKEESFLNPKAEAILRTIDPGVRDNTGKTPLHYAAMSGSEVCVNVLTRPLGAKLSLPLSQDNNGATPLHLAALYGHTRICEILIRETEAPDLIFMPDAFGNTPLHCAALGKNSDTLECILARGGLVSSTNLKYQTAFHMVPMPPPHRTLMSYAEKSNWVSDAVRMCASLLEYGADIQAEDDQGWTPLDYALGFPQAHIPPIPPPIFEDKDSSLSSSLSSIPSQLNMSPRSSSPSLSRAHPYSHSSTSISTSSLHSSHSSDQDDIATCCVAQFLVERGATTHTRDARLDTCLHRVAAGGCADCLRALLDRGEDVESVGAKGRTPLHLAAAHGNATLVNILLEYGANTQSRSAALLTPLHQAARHGSYMCAELLLAHGAIVDALCARDWTPLHHACAMGHTDLIALLVDHGADVNNTDTMGRTPLHKATYYSHPECVMWLVERGAQTNAEDENGETPVHYAAIRGLSAALIFMSAVGADLARPTKKGSTPIHLAARHENVDTAMFLIEKDPQALAAVTQKGRTALHIAARYGKEQMTQLLLEHGADCNATDIFGNTPLHMACKGSSVTVVSHLLTLTYTHRQGANPNSPNMHGITPLHLAALCATPEVLVRLIEGGAEINRLDDMGRSPIIYALQGQNFTCAHKLLELGCSVEGTDEDGRTLLHVAAQHNATSFIASLTPLRASQTLRFYPALRDAEDNTALHTAASVGALEAVQALLGRVAEGEEKKQLLETQNALGRTALHLAAFYGQFSVGEFLLSKGANLEALDLTNSTPLHLCTAAGQDPTFFIQKGANVGAVSDKGLYIIHTAAAGGSVRCVEKILELRPDDINALTEEGDTPLHVAVRFGHPRVVSALLSHNTEALDAPNSVGCAPLHFASLYGSVPIVTILIESLANLNLQDSQGRRPLHFAAMSNQKECATLLLRRGVNPAPPDLDGRTPLHLAAARGQKAIVALLLSQNGIDPNVLDNEEATPLAYALANEHQECIELLQIHAKPT